MPVGDSMIEGVYSFELWGSKSYQHGGVNLSPFAIIFLDFKLVVGLRTER